MMSNPYSNMKPYQNWYKSIQRARLGFLDLKVPKTEITKQQKISTMGSCFAQNIGRHLVEKGFNYYVVEKSKQKIDIENGYGIFSCRFGNVYTVKQALQLFNRAFSLESFEENIWKVNDDYIDAFRPLAVPKKFKSKEILHQDRVYHLGKVREMFTETDVFIFTLGLTEAWSNKLDGAVFPIAPGVVGGGYSRDLHSFVNFRFAEIIKDLFQLCDNLTDINPKIKIILTVSPVPLVATYEDRHVLVSTVASKSTLRAVCDEVQKERTNVFYFPSYEIITNHIDCKDHFEADFRNVSSIGINKVMMAFDSFVGNSLDYERFMMNSSSVIEQKIICDEEEIQHSVEKLGL